MAIVLELKIIPGSGRQRIVLNKSGGITCYVKSAPVDGKANRELIEYIADELRVPKRAIEIVSGATSRHKRIRIESTASEQEILDRLGVGDRQDALF